MNYFFFKKTLNIFLTSTSQLQSWNWMTLYNENKTIWSFSYTLYQRHKIWTSPHKFNSLHLAHKITAQLFSFKSVFTCYEKKCYFYLKWLIYLIVKTFPKESILSLKGYFTLGCNIPRFLLCLVHLSRGVGKLMHGLYCMDL